MAAEQLSSFCSQLSINEGEQSKVVLTKEWLEEDDEGAPVFFLIGKLFSKRRANLEGMRTALFNAWSLDSEADCLLAVDMRKAHGKVSKKYSAKLKAGSPRPKSNRFEGGEGLAQLSYSASNSRRPFRHHVDSMVLRGKQVARAIFPDDSSCEVLSRNPERAVPQHLEGGNPVGLRPRNVERPVGLVAGSGEEGSRFEADIQELYGDLGVTAALEEAHPPAGFQDSVANCKGKAKVAAGFQGDSSTDSSSPLYYGGSYGHHQFFRNGTLRGQQSSGSVSHHSIPGLGRQLQRGMCAGIDRPNGGLDGANMVMDRGGTDGPYEGSLRAGLGPDLMGLVKGLGRDYQTIRSLVGLEILQAEAGARCWS
ncbi:hypothetical protein COLO4_16073 [Corchorus olitorius]|uniref:DUF4283 domain-containing protein n=1 Tax=Corchorus olitorius TaxID=93759 RepID=A0A1R3JJU0_9ROSI|nr:hypothetical protein COLO4_16073 [Corchorus olitorius]